MKNATAIRVFGQRLRKLREARGMSQQELADYADIAKPTIQRTEHGQSAVTLDVLLSLAQALDVPLHDLVNLSQEEKEWDQE